MPQENTALPNAEKKMNPDLSKIDSQSPDTPESTGVPENVMEILDMGMSEISESKDLNGSIKNIISKLQGMVKEETKSFSRKELSTF
jgi:hypothetical protein